MDLAKPTNYNSFQFFDPTGWGPSSMANDWDQRLLVRVSRD